MISEIEEKKKIRSYMVSLVLISFAAFAYSYRQILESYNSTVLAFSYEYGFISRGLIGTLYSGLDKILPVDLLDYEAALTVMIVTTLIIFIALLIMAYKTVRLCPEKYRYVVELIWVFLMMIIITTFSSRRNLGRLDLFMILFSLIAVYLIIVKKMEWLCIPLSCLGVMVHQGYVFMYIGIILVLLLYQYFNTKERKYLIICIGSFVGASLLFLWFQFFSHSNGAQIVQDITDKATLLAEDGEYHETLIQAEILGVDLTKQEWPMHVENWIELPFFLLLMSPYIVMLVTFFRKLLQKSEDRISKIKNIIIILGALTILPNFILKVDYARWFMAVIIYYLVAIMALTIIGDKVFKEVLEEYMVRIRDNKVAYSILVIYPVLFLPFWDVHICQALKNISNPINEAFLHLW